jgi:deoxyribodipyrimidine photolyase-related protein
MASKPYAASGKYINRMSNFCARCRFDPKETVGEDACPFNSLYWDFMDRNREKLKDNHRLFNVYAAWDRMDGARRAEILQQAHAFLKTLR